MDGLVSLNSIYTKNPSTFLKAAQSEYDKNCEKQQNGYQTSHLINYGHICYLSRRQPTRILSTNPKALYLLILLLCQSIYYCNYNDLNAKVIAHTFLGDCQVLDQRLFLYSCYLYQVSRLYYNIKKFPLFSVPCKPPYNLNNKNNVFIF